VEAKMTNYELVPAKIPANKGEAEAFEAWLERISGAGGELVCFLPTMNSSTMLAVVRSGPQRPLAQFKKLGYLGLGDQLPIVIRAGRGASEDRRVSALCRVGDN
jgi:hypothetical protein